MESLVHGYISSSFDDELNEDLLERRLSPYATLRPGDLAALLRLHTPLLSLVNKKFSRSHGNDNSLRFIAWSPREVDVILERKEEQVLCADENVNDNDDSTERICTLDIVCRGSDTNDSPAEYIVKGLHHHEMPVIGVFVDKRICPGFKYTVRRAGSKGALFNNKPKTLLSIGMGYGKRITFSGDNLNNNECYFWSDSEPEGYAFTIHTVDVGQRLSIVDTDNVIVGEALIDTVDQSQKEISCVVKDRTVIKRVEMTMTCSMKYYQRHNHGLVDMMVHEDLKAITGEAVLTKHKSSKGACLTSIQQVFLQPFGLCSLKPDV